MPARSAASTTRRVPPTLTSSKRRPRGLARDGDQVHDGIGPGERLVQAGAGGHVGGSSLHRIGPVREPASGPGNGDHPMTRLDQVRHEVAANEPGRLRRSRCSCTYCLRFSCYCQGARFFLLRSGRCPPPPLRVAWSSRPTRSPPPPASTRCAPAAPPLTPPSRPTRCWPSSIATPAASVATPSRSSGIPASGACMASTAAAAPPPA